MKRICLLFLGVSLWACSQKTSIMPMNTQMVSGNQDIRQLVAGMTLEEKIGQTCQITLDVILKRKADGTAVEPAEIDQKKWEEAVEKYKVGSVLNVGSHTLTRSEWQNIHNNIHRPFVSGKTKLPIIYGIDAIHGMNYAVGATLFPHEIGLAATWNPQLVEDCASITAYEARAVGIPWNFSPVLDLGRQPLWSRHFETFGEDPFLCAELGEAMIQGYQGRGKISLDKVAACLKHYVGYSAPISGRDRTPAWIPNKYLWELYLPSFKKAVDAGAKTVMINSGVLNGIPGHQNHHLLTEVLKGTLGFKGFAVSDWEDFIMLHSVHKTAENLKDAYILAFNAGVDMSMVPLAPQYQEYCSLMKEAVQEGRISEDRLNDAVSRILQVKQDLELFDKKTFDTLNYPEFGSEAHRLKAENAALESITLLKNNGALPLSNNKKILVAGPTSNDDMYLNGAWTHTWQGNENQYNTKGALNIRQALEKRVGKENILFSQGAELFLNEGFESTRFVDTADYHAKVKKCDVVLLCLGEYPSVEKPGDIRSLRLDDAQLELAKIAYAEGKEVVLILVEGRPRLIHEIVEPAKAIVQCYLPGDQGGIALEKLLFGDANFSGKLPYTYPKYDGVVEFYDHPASVARSKAGDFSAFDPEWEFGHGLSYSSFRYRNLTLDKEFISGDEKLKVTVTVENTSAVPGKEIVQLYLSDEVASMIPAGKRLRGFQKIAVPANSSVMVTFYLGKDDFVFYDNEEHVQLESGNFTIQIDALQTRFHYTK
jgi:beta-glucosidase